MHRERGAFDFRAAIRKCDRLRDRVRPLSYFTRVPGIRCSITIGARKIIGHDRLAVRCGVGHRGIIEPVANLSDPGRIVILNARGVTREYIRGAAKRSCLQRGSVAPIGIDRDRQCVRRARLRTAVCHCE